MPRIHILPDDVEIEVDAQQSLLEASLAAGTTHAHACGGRGRCSTCRVLVLSGAERCPPPTGLERQIAARLGFGDDIRLACQTRPTGDVTIRRLVLDPADEMLTSLLGPGAGDGRVGVERRLAIMFADIAGFTPFAAALPPYDVTHVLNRYFFHLGQAIERYDGTIQNYMGDGLVALFGLERRRGAALNAVRAGLDMLAAMDELKPYLRAFCGRAFDTRIGIHYGTAIVGAIGAPGTQRLSAIGDAVNMASRIEAANKVTGTRLLISAATRQRVKGEIALGPAHRLTLPGKSGRYSLYEPLGVRGA